MPVFGSSVKRDLVEADIFPDKRAGRRERDGRARTRHLKPGDENLPRKTHTRSFPPPATRKRPQAHPLSRKEREGGVDPPDCLFFGPLV